MSPWIPVDKAEPELREFIWLIEPPHLGQHSYKTRTIVANGKALILIVQYDEDTPKKFTLLTHPDETQNGLDEIAEVSE